MAETYPRRGMMVVVSDLLGDEDGTLRGLRLLRQQGHDVMVFHVMDDDELSIMHDVMSRVDDKLTNNRQRPGDPTIG